MKREPLYPEAPISSFDGFPQFDCGHPGGRVVITWPGMQLRLCLVDARSLRRLLDNAINAAVADLRDVTPVMTVPAPPTSVMVDYRRTGDDAAQTA